MSILEPASQNGRPPDESQLNGWKDIAAFFGKGVRTVQRWEREMGLPVRRLPGPRGDIVFAFPSELRAWQQKLEEENDHGEDVKLHDQKPPSPLASSADGAAADGTAARSRRWGRVFYLVGAAILVGLAALASFRVFRDMRPSGGKSVLGPVTADVRGNTLVALDERGTPLWSYRFDTPLEPYYPPPSPSSHLLKIVDIDGDGRAETLFFAAHQAPHGAAFYCFESGGGVRFKRTLGSRHTYGKEVFAAPWRGHRLLAHEPTLRSGEIWIAWTHAIEFPSVLQRLDTKGRLLNEFWNDGFIDTFVPVERGTRRLLLVGGTNNEHKTGFLAVIDRRSTGFSPAINQKYACVDCEGAYPERYFVFPRLDVAVVQENLSWTTRIEPDDAGQTMIGVNQAHDPATVYYRFGPEFNLIRSEIGPEFVALHRQLEARRLLLHPFGPADERAAADVRVWDGKGFAPLPGGGFTPSATALRAGTHVLSGTR